MRIHKPKARLAPVCSPTIKDIAWAAGIYEGEGTCFLTSGTTKVQVDQKDPWLLYKLQKLFGGSVGVMRAEQPLYGWYLYGGRARGFLYTVYSFLSPRRKLQAQKALGLQIKSS